MCQIRLVVVVFCMYVSIPAVTMFVYSELQLSATDGMWHFMSVVSDTLLCDVDAVGLFIRDRDLSFKYGGIASN